MSSANKYEPTVIYKDDSYALNAIHIHKKYPTGYQIIEMVKPLGDREEMGEEILYQNDELTLEKATSMALEYAIEENEENGNRFKWIFLPEEDKPQ